MPKDNEMTIHTNFKQIGGDYQNARRKYIKLEKEAQTLIDKETKEEKEQLDIAFKKYNNKMQEVAKSEKFKEIEQNALTYSNEMGKNLLKAKDSFIKVKEEIMNKDWNEEKKSQKIEELYNYVLEKLYSKEEIEKFKSMMSSIVIM